MLKIIWRSLKIWVCNFEMENVYLIADNHFFVIIVFLSDAVMHLLYPSPKNFTTAYRHVVVTVKALWVIRVWG